MATEVQDDYLGCGAYQANIVNNSAEHPGFITFKEANGDHFFAWVHNNAIVMRSEAYPDAEKMERGIKAILKNWDLPERYSVIEGEGGHLLLMYGGGDHMKHTGNFEKHSEIGRSCPAESRTALNALLAGPKGQAFADTVIPLGNVKAAAAPVAAAVTAAAATVAAAAAPAASATTTTVKETAAAATAAATSYTDDAAAAAGGGLGWLKWLLPLLLLGALLYWWKGCNKDGAAATTETSASTAVNQTDTNKVPVVEPTKTSLLVKLADGTEINAYKGGIEDQLVTFLNDKTAVLDTANKKAHWYNFDDLNFIFGKTQITDSSRKQITNLVAIMKAYPNLKFKIGAYTDKKGDDAANMKLSQGRADNVLAEIKKAGGDISRITKAEGYGETLAEVPETASDAERLKDRRTAIRVVNK
jgi:outer membrane protein OmpA-like peptidoglycan-associated protein